MEQDAGTRDALFSCPILFDGYFKFFFTCKCGARPKHWYQFVFFLKRSSWCIFCFCSRCGPNYKCVTVVLGWSGHQQMHGTCALYVNEECNNYNGQIMLRDVRVDGRLFLRLKCLTVCAFQEREWKWMAVSIPQNRRKDAGLVFRPLTPDVSIASNISTTQLKSLANIKKYRPSPYLLQLKTLLLHSCASFCADSSLPQAICVKCTVVL